MNDLKFKLKIYLDNNLIENKENVLFEDFCEANYKINSDYIKREAGSFVKQRDYNRLEDGKYPIIYNKRQKD